jgi:hypothetical protein
MVRYHLDNADAESLMQCALSGNDSLLDLSSRTSSEVYWRRYPQWCRGADQLEGGTGNDTYFINNPGDLIVEFNGRGIDTVKSSISFVLPATPENLTLIGTTAVSGTGNEGSNQLTGNAATNVLTGNGGADVINGDGGGATLPRA